MLGNRVPPSSPNAPLSTTPRSSVWRVAAPSIRRVFGANARRFALFILTYAILYKSVSLADHDNASALWFPDAVLLCWLLLAPRNEWWFYLLAPLPIRLLIESPFRVPVWFLIVSYANDSLKGAFSAWVLERVLRRPVRLDSLRALNIFLLVAAVLSPALSSVIGAVARWAMGYGFATSLYQWFVGDALAALVMTPALLYWFTDYAEWKPHWKELTLLLGSLVLVLSYAFLAAPGVYRPLLLYAPIPFLIWAAVRLGPIGTSTALSLIAAASITGAAMGKGVFALNSSPQGLLSLQLFLAVVSIPLLLLAVMVKERTRATAALQDSEKRFRLVANTAPVMIWMSGPDKLCSYFNQPWLKFTGRTLEEELGTGWSQGVHPDDLDRCWKTYSESFEKRKPFEMQYRLRRLDAEYRWVSDIGVPRFDANGSFAGYIGSCIDITDHKLAQETLASLGRKLIEAHEEERTWIARELHDDINQRIALISVELQQWDQHLYDSQPNGREHIQNIRERLVDLGKDVQSLSHHLHSSKLELLGLVAAARSFCKEFAAQHKVEIDFSHTNVPGNLPKEISLCLYRVLQEALQNALKHSGVRYFTVDLDGRPGEVQMQVSDTGTGFVQHRSGNHQGLGLISMRERLQIVKGELSIKSAPGRGTTIQAVVSFSSSDHASAAV
jgi:PAS domain S-box-containing protein